MRVVVVSAMIVLGAAGLATWYLATHEKIEEEVWVGYRGEARYNPFLAAERLLIGVGVEAGSRESFRPSRWLPPARDTLVMRASAGVSTGDEFDSLTAWVTDYGGHLVLLPPSQPGDAVDNLLAFFGLKLVVPEPEVAGDATELAAHLDPRAVENVDYALMLAHADYRIETARYDTVATLSDDAGNIAVRVAEGDGYVTVVASGDFFSNMLIDEADHARLLLDVVAGYLDPGKVWLIFQSSFPSLGDLIWEAAPLLVLTLAALFGLWLWATMPSFGPRAEPAAEDRRSISEHVSAAGAFTWRHAGSEVLADSAVTALLHAAERRHPGIGRLAAEKQAESLAHLTGLDVELIFNALISAGRERPREFADTIQLLQTIRKAL